MEATTGVGHSAYNQEAAGAPEALGGGTLALAHSLGKERKHHDAGTERCGRGVGTEHMRRQWVQSACIQAILQSAMKHNTN